MFRVQMPSVLPGRMKQGTPSQHWLSFVQAKPSAAHWWPHWCIASQ
jgi:hypothetical protein